MSFNNAIHLALKGLAIGAANVIPGVSGGTIALVTGIYQELIESLKSFNKHALKLILKGEFKQFSKHTNLNFLFYLSIGICGSVFSIAKLFDWLLDSYPTYIWAFFFGLILASVYHVGKTVEHWTFKEISFLIVGTLIAICISFTNPLPSTNENYFFIFFCGIIGIIGMLLPGLSGSYILMLLGNYKLLMVDSINTLSKSIKMSLSFDFSFIENTEMTQNLYYFILFIFGSLFGVLSFSKLISWVFQRYKNCMIAVLTGFVFGSLSIIWPWKNEITKADLLNRHGQKVVIGYERFIPNIMDTQLYISLICIVLGILCIWLIEKTSRESAS